MTSTYNVTTANTAVLDIRFARKRRYWIYFTGGPLDGRESYYSTPRPPDNWSMIVPTHVTENGFSYPVYRVCRDGGNRLVLVYAEQQQPEAKA
jgi:hypothetical protein